MPSTRVLLGLALYLLLPFVRTQNTATSPIVIETLYSTLWSHRTPGGNDPGLFVKTNPNVTFSPGALIKDSVNSTDGGVTPTVIGIEIVSRREGQVMEGGGCGVTDSAAIALQEFRANNAEAYEEIMDLLFSQDDSVIENGGVAVNNVRSPLGASDFAGALYSYDDTTDCSPDTSLSLFRIDQAQYLWRTHLDALKRNPYIDHFFAPWSAPAWMKQPKEGQRCSMIGGHLKSEYIPVFAEYLAKSMEAIKAKLGKTPFALSIQNEPILRPKNYPGDVLSPAEGVQIADLTRAALDAKGLQAIGLTNLDFNWGDFQWALDTLDNSSAWNSISWHCYGGDPANQLVVSNAFPRLPMYMTECTVITNDNSELWKNLREQSIRMLFDTIQGGSSRSIFWNCVLFQDENGFTSPTLPKVCDDCSSPVTVFFPFAAKNASTQPSARGENNVPATIDGKVARSFPLSRRQSPKALYKLNSDYVVLLHLHRATRPRTSTEKNAIKIGSDTTEQKYGYIDGERVRVSAFKTPLASGQHRYSVIALQKNDHFLTGKYENTTLQIGFEGMVANITLPCGLHTFSWVA